jgi:hypothetical protein
MTVLTLTGLPAGSYAIDATASEFSGSLKTALVGCELAAGGAPGSGEPPAKVETIIGNETQGSSGQDTIPFLLLHTFAANGGTITLSCTEELSTERVEVSGARIHAVKVVSESSIAG